jgi:molybdopterin-guanine dinucleotide biosynthesis protein A
VTILGAIFAGGAARRFGSDKAAALIEGIAMIDHVAARLSAQCDAVVVVGREWPGLTTVSDLPRPGLGPLGALAGALGFARANGHEAVLSSGCDLPDLPLDLREKLWPGPAVVQGQPLLGLWPSNVAVALVEWLEGGGDRAMRSWIAHAGARRVALPEPPSNINTVEDWEAYLTHPSRSR